MPLEITGEIQQIKITRKRGDTKAIAMTLKDDAGVVVPINAATFKLTVTPEENPATNANELFVLPSTIVSDINGKIKFSMSLAQSDNIGIFFCDIQMTETGGEISTIAEGSFIFEQDRTK